MKLKRRYEKKEKVENLNDERSEDFDFDMSIYEKESDFEDEETPDFFNGHLAPIINMRARFSNGQAELDRLAELNIKASELAIKVYARTQDKQTLWNFLGVLNEMWASYKYLHGQHADNQFKKYDRFCSDKLEKSNGSIPHEVHRYLLKYRDAIYRCRQYANLGFEVEKRRGGTFSKSKRQIIQ